MSDPRYPNNDPNRVPPYDAPRSTASRSYDRDRGTSYAIWIIGAVVALGLIGGLLYGMSSDRTQTATNPPPATTGQTNRPISPAPGANTTPNAPANDPAPTNPAPAPRPSTNP